MNKRGQMALILTFVAAVGLILFAMSLNVNRVALNKLQVTISANQGAGLLVSRLASYGEQTMQTQLGGKKEKCSWSGVFMAIIMVIIIIIVIIVSIVSHQYELIYLSTPMLVVMIAALAIAIAAVLIQALVVQPAITRMWNKMQQNIPTQEDQFLQSGMQSALQYAITDDKMIYDYFDFNMNGKAAGKVDFRTCPPTTVPGAPQNDKVLRFVYYYTQYLEQFKNYKLEYANEFRRTLQDTLRTLGMEDRSCGNGGCVNVKGDCQTSPAQFINPCCVYPDIRPTSCHPDIADRSAYPWLPDACKPANYPINPGALPGPTNYQDYALAYDPFFCNRQLEGGLPAIIGRDDGNQHLKKIASLMPPLFTTNVAANNPAADEAIYSDAPNGPAFRGEDSDGLLIPLFWMLHDTRPYVEDLMSTGLTTTSDACHWCSQTVTGGLCNLATQDALDTSRYRFGKIVGASLFDPSTDIVQLSLGSCSGDNCCVNTFRNDPLDNTKSDTTRHIDKVGLFSPTMFAPNTDCPPAGEWRPGSDAFCGTGTPAINKTPSIPYNVCPFFNSGGGCSSTLTDGSLNNSTCECSAGNVSGNANQWRDDDFDSFYSWMQNLAKEARELVRPGYAEHLSEGVSEWAPGAKRLLDEFVGGNSDGTVTFDDSWLGKMTKWSKMIADWQKANYADNGLWCLPTTKTLLPAAELGIVDDGSSLYFPTTDGALYSKYGSLDSVLRCLRLNMDNETKYKACADYCNNAANAAVVPSTVLECQKLPRSLMQAAGTDINSTLSASGATCANQQQLINDSHTLAIDQATKMAKRFNYLKAVRDRAIKIRTNLDAIIGYLPTAVAKMRDLIQKLEDNDTTGAKVENQLIYGWKTNPTPLSPNGLWHLVKVEAWVPKRCDGFTENGENGCCAEKFPWVKTYKKGEMKRCYGMKDHSGRIKVRTTRYDASSTSSVNFANTIPLWTFHQNNPFQTNSVGSLDLSGCEFSSYSPPNYTRTCRGDGARTSTNPPDQGPWTVTCDAGDAVSTCSTLASPPVPCSGSNGCTLTGTQCTGMDCTLECIPSAAYKAVNMNLHRNWDACVAPGAFVIFGPNDYADRRGTGALDCATNVLAALQNGVTSEVCADYILDGIYKIKFGRCDTSCAWERIRPNS